MFYKFTVALSGVNVARVKALGILVFLWMSSHHCTAENAVVYTNRAKFRDSTLCTLRVDYGRKNDLNKNPGWTEDHIFSISVKTALEVRGRMATICYQSDAMLISRSGATLD